MTQKKQSINEISPWLKWIRYTGVISFLIIFGFILTVGFSGKRDMQNLIDNGIETQATIIDLQVGSPAADNATSEQRSEQTTDSQAANRSLYVILYDYKDNNGISHQSSRYSNKSYFEQREIGQQWPIRYLPEQPSIHELNMVVESRISNLSILNITLRAAGLGMFGILLFELLRLITAIMIKKQRIKARQ